MSNAIKQQIKDLMADELIATDEGTHGHAKTVKVYEKLDGSRYGVVYMGGSVVGTCPADTDSPHGRMRHLKYLPASERRKEIERLEKLLAKS